MSAPAGDAQARLQKASKELLSTLNDRTVGAADRWASGLTERLHTLAEDGGGQLPRPRLPDTVKDRTSRLGGTAGRLGRTASGKAGDLGGRISDAVGAVAHGAGRLVPHPRHPDSEEPDPDTRDEADRGRPAGSSPKVTTIIEEIDVGVPVSFAYDQWTEFDSFPSFMKKVEVVDAVTDQRIRWKAQIWWSHREWETTILEQRPDERIVWVSEGTKGRVDGAVTFHELAPDLTRMIVVLEYHPQGLLEHTANLWRAQGRRVRSELQHFRRHVMAHAVLDPDRVQGWRGVIEGGEVVAGPEDEESVDDERADDEEAPQDEEEPADEAEEEPEYEDEDEDEEPEDEDEEPEYEDEEPEPEDEDEEPEDEAESGDDVGAEIEAEYAEDEEEQR